MRGPHYFACGAVAHAEEIQTGTRGGKTATIGGVDRKNRWGSGRIPYRSNGRKRGTNENLAGGTAGGIEDHVFVLVETDMSTRGLGKGAIGQQNLPPVAEGKRIVVGVAHGMYSRIADGKCAGIATFDAVSASAHIECTILNAHSKGGASVEEQSDARGIDGESSASRDEHREIGADTGRGRCIVHADGAIALDDQPQVFDLVEEGGFVVGDVGVVEGEDFVFGIVDDTARDARPFELSAYVVSLAGDVDFLGGSVEIPSGSEEEGEEEKNCVLLHGVVGSRESAAKWVSK